MNILIAAISTFSAKFNPSCREYTISVGDGKGDVSFEAYHTNESILRGFHKKLGSENIDQIIALLSNDAKNKLIEIRLDGKSEEELGKLENEFGGLTAWGYYKKVAKSLYPNVTTVPVDIEDDANNPLSQGTIIKDICRNILSTKDVIYLDMAGGQRTNADVIQLVTKVLTYLGCTNPLSLYSNIQGSKARIESTGEFMKMASIADAVHEFVTTGKSAQFAKCFEGTKNERVARLITMMNEFSDKIRLGDIDSLDGTINGLRTAILKAKTIDDDETEYVILLQLLPLIEEKLLANAGDNTINYPALVRWCVDNSLLQQALAIFTEKLPVWLSKTGIVSYKYNTPTEYDSSKVTSPEVFVFYNKLLTQAYDVDMYENWIDDYKRHVLNVDCKMDKLMDKTVRYAVGKLGFWVDKQALREFLRSMGTDNLPELLLQDDSLILEMFRRCAWVSMKDFDAASMIELGMYNRGLFDIVIDDGKLAEIAYAYLYVKRTRNRMSHILKDEQITEYEQDILSARGYDFSQYSINTVSENIRHALKAVEQACNTNVG